MEKKTIKIALLIFYFGSFPSFFPYFLSSCARNPEITWLIYTDQEKKESWPKNVKHIPMTFDACCEMFQKRFDFPVFLSSPKKLCDYKPAYGYIMEESLCQYDYWGYTDLDMIWGKAFEFLPEDLEKYDKLYTLGHFTLYRNNPEVNRLFMKFDDGKRCREVFTSSHMRGFDEWGSGNINEIFRASSYTTFDKEFGADVWPGQTDFWLSGIDDSHRLYKKISETNGIFHLREGKLYWCDINGNYTEYPYVHLQKRILKGDFEPGTENFYIVPNVFLSDQESEGNLIKKYTKSFFLDRQYFYMKWYNFKRHLKLLFSGK